MARDVRSTYDADSDTTTRTVHFTRIQPERCDAAARRGTGTGTCQTPLDEHGTCPSAGAHVS